MIGAYISFLEAFLHYCKNVRNVKRNALKDLKFTDVQNPFGQIIFIEIYQGLN